VIPDGGICRSALQLVIINPIDGLVPAAPAKPNGRSAAPRLVRLASSCREDCRED
jgi:hypothetical protein